MKELLGYCVVSVARTLEMASQQFLKINSKITVQPFLKLESCGYGTRKMRQAQGKGF